MNIDNLAGMFSQKSSVQQSMGNSIMSAIIGFMAQSKSTSHWRDSSIDSKNMTNG